MQQSQAVTTDSSYTAQQIADMLAVVMWADNVVTDGIESISSCRSRFGLSTVHSLESLLVSLRPIADARAELARLDGGRLLDGFDVWAARQRAVMKALSSSSPDRP